MIRSPRWWCRLCRERGIGDPDGWKQHANRVHSYATNPTSSTQIAAARGFTHNGRYVWQRPPMAFGFQPPDADQPARRPEVVFGGDAA